MPIISHATNLTSTDSSYLHNLFGDANIVRTIPKSLLVLTAPEVVPILEKMSVHMLLALTLARWPRRAST